MKDLQSFLDEMPLEQVQDLHEVCSMEKPTPQQSVNVLNFLKKVYESEMDVEFTLDEKLIEYVCKDLNLKLALYINVRSGDMVIKKGRIGLIKDDASFSLTPQGIKKVESMGK